MLRTTYWVPSRKPKRTQKSCRRKRLRVSWEAVGRPAPQGTGPGIWDPEFSRASRAASHLACRPTDSNISPTVWSGEVWGDLGGNWNIPCSMLQGYGVPLPARWASTVGRILRSRTRDPSRTTRYLHRGATSQEDAIEQNKKAKRQSKLQPTCPRLVGYL